SSMRVIGVAPLNLLLFITWGEPAKSALDAVVGREIYGDALLWQSSHDSLVTESGLLRESQARHAADASDGSGGPVSQTADQPIASGASSLPVFAARCSHCPGQS